MINKYDIEKIQPMYDRILVKKDYEKENKTLGGIFIPDQAKERAQTGTVIACGEGKLLASGSLSPLKIKKGDRVFFGKYAGTEIEEDYIILREEEILGLI